MKKIVFLFLIVSLCMFSCKKGNEPVPEEKEAKGMDNIEKTQYLKWATWVFSNKDDLGKDAKDVKEKKLLEFGNKVEITDELKHNDKLYYQIKLPDESTYYVLASNLTEAFIIITDTNISTYSQPSEDYPITKYKLQPGDFAYFVKNQNGFISVEFISYLPNREKNKDATWPTSPAWLVEGVGYTTDTKAARDGYFLARTYNKMYGKAKDKDGAIKDMQDYLNDDGLVETDVTYVIRNLLNELTVTEVVNDVSDVNSVD